MWVMAPASSMIATHAKVTVRIVRLETENALSEGRVTALLGVPSEDYPPVPRKDKCFTPWATRRLPASQAGRRSRSYMVPLPGAGAGREVYRHRDFQSRARVLVIQVDQDAPQSGSNRLQPR